MGDEYSVDEKRELLRIARETIKTYLDSGEKKYPQNTNPKFLEKRGVFVTLHCQGDLRGCIGYPLPIKSLLDAVVDNVIASATEDPRFNSVTSDQLDDIDIEISILTVPSEVGSINDIKIGQDGIIVSKGFMRGLLLPQVPVEQKWDLEEYISYGCIKAGLAKDEWKQGVKIETFQATVFAEKDLKSD
jgi:AmmeMemoRadiSam system protein A